MTSFFTRFANQISRLAGRAMTFVVCISLVIVWAVSGPMFGFSDTWQLVINTSTTIVTFLMVFLIQNTQNRDNAALQAKLDELIRSSAAENDLIGIEKLTDKELEEILAEFEDKAVPLGEKSRIIAQKARAARDKEKGKASPQPAKMKTGASTKRTPRASRAA